MCNFYTWSEDFLNSTSVHSTLRYPVKLCYICCELDVLECILYQTTTCRVNMSLTIELLQSTVMFYMKL